MELEERRKKHKEYLTEKIRFWESSVTARGQDLIDVFAEVMVRLDDLREDQRRLGDEVAQLKEGLAELKRQV